MKSEIKFEVKDTEFWFRIDLTSWALPLFITWGMYSEWLFFHITFLCFRFNITHWNFDEASEETTLKELNNVC